MDAIKSLHKVIPGQKLKVAAYARISNDKECLETSLEEQVDYYTRVIVMNPDWEFSGIYFDNGISGTTADQRTGFMNMIDNARVGLIDIILVKSISRFARNIIDLLTIVRELRNKGIEIYFESQNISSLDTKCDQMITMYAEFAQEESLSVSDNVRWRIEKNIRDGKYHLPVNQMLGYKYDDCGKIVIYEPEAKIIRLIYSLYLEGNGCISIVQYLTRNNIPNKQGIVSWGRSTVRGILRNEKYVGDYLFHKSYVPNPLDHKTKLNHGQVEQFIVKNGHPAIIERKKWDKVQEMMDENAERFKVPTYDYGTYNPNDFVSIFEKFVICPHCKKNYISKLNHYNGKASHRFLMCSNNRYTKICKDSENYPFDVFEQILIKQIKLLKTDLSYFKDFLTKEFKDTDKESRSKEIEAIDKQIAKYKASMEEIKNYFDDFYADLKTKYLNEIGLLTKKKVMLQNEAITSESVESRIDRIIKAIKETPASPESIEEIDFRSIFSKAVIVNKKLIYFIIGNPNMDKYPLNPKIRFKGQIQYKVRITEYSTTFGIIVNK